MEVQLSKNVGVCRSKPYLEPNLIVSTGQQKNELWLIRIRHVGLVCNVLTFPAITGICAHNRNAVKMVWTLIHWYHNFEN